MYVIRSQVDKDARLNIATGIDMKITTAPSNASSNVGGIVPEVNNEDWLLVAEALCSPTSHQLPLLCGRHQPNIRIKTDRDVEEMPADEAAFL